MVRKILAVAIGLIVCSVVVGLVEQLGHFLYPYPKALDPNKIEDVQTYIRTAPFMALFFVIIAYASGAVFSGFVSSVIANDGRKIYAIIVGTVFLLVSVYMMSVLPTPIWFWILGISVWSLVLLGWKIAQRFKKNKI